MPVLVCCGVIVSGFLLGLKAENSSVPLSLFGVAYGILASLSVALYAIFTKHTLPVVDGNIWKLQFYNNANAVVILAPLMLLMRESPILIAFQHWTSAYFWFILVITGVFGIAIGYVSTLQIQVTSPLTHNISGTAKAGAQTVLACVIFSEVKTWWWWLSNMMVLGGSSAYTYVRMNEMKNNSNNNRATGEGRGGGGGGGREGELSGKTLQILEGSSEEPGKETQQFNSK